MDGILHIWNLAAAGIWFKLLSTRVERLADKRQHNTAAGFLFGGVFSIGIAVVLSLLYPLRLQTVLSASSFLYHVSVVGIVEESAKFLTFLFMVHGGGTIREPQDGVIYAALVGIAFGTVENIGYINSFDTFFMWLRPVLTTGGHGVYCAIWGGLYSQAVYANSVGSDPGATRGSAIGIPLVALIHGTYNALTRFYPAALLLDIASLLFAVSLFERLVALSPYRTYPLSQAKRAIASIRRGLAFNPKSSILNRNLGLYLMHVGRYRAASTHFRTSMQRSRDPRRARFLAAACAVTYLPRIYALRELRIAWARLADDQREIYMRRLRELVADRDGIAEKVESFIAAAFAPRKYKNTRDIALEQKLKRIKRRRKQVGTHAVDAIEELTPEKRARLARRMRGGR